jgi:hypothetical protein
VLVLVDDERVEAFLDEVADAQIAVVEPVRDPPIEPLHAAREAVEQRFDNQVVVVRHHAVRVIDPSEAEAGLPDPVVDEGVVELVARDQHAIHAARGHVVDAVLRKQVAGPWHAANGDRTRPAGERR